jgi:hypothetical protein
MDYASSGFYYTTWKVDHGKPTAKTPRTPRGAQIVGFSFSLAAISLLFLGVLGVLAVDSY